MKIFSDFLKNLQTFLNSALPIYEGEIIGMLVIDLHIMYEKILGVSLSPEDTMALGLEELSILLWISGSLTYYFLVYILQYYYMGIFGRLLLIAIFQIYLETFKSLILLSKPPKSKG